MSARPGRAGRLVSLSIAFLLAGLAYAGPPSSGSPAGRDGDRLLQGERLYREGLLPSGEPVKALVQRDIEVEGSMFSCESCHQRSGLGSMEGGVFTLPTGGKKLYEPYDYVKEQPDWQKVRQVSRVMLSRYGKMPNRPAYDDNTLAHALRYGFDPNGRELDPIMPRYELDDAGMGLLIDYLKTLSVSPSPGVTDNALKFATVVTEEVPEESRNEMVALLKRYMGARSNPALAHNNRKLHGSQLRIKQQSNRKWSLSVWTLTGPPGTWRSQLEEYYRNEPVFALVGGISTREWRPIHEFCEAFKVPCLFPLTDLPVISSTDWYTIYFSKGFYQEGEFAARHVARREGLKPDARIVQVYEDTPEGRAFAAGFRDTLKDYEHSPPIDRPVSPGAKPGGEALRSILGGEKPDVLLSWLGPDCMPVLESARAAGGGAPIVYLSATLLGGQLLSVPESMRADTFITYPYGFPEVDKTAAPVGMPMGGGRRKLEPLITDGRVDHKVSSLCTILSGVVKVIQENFYRDYLLDIICMGEFNPDSPYERLSFGPNQRYASKGCYLVQLSPGPAPKLVRKSEWVEH